MTGSDKAIGQLAALLLLFTLASTPAKAQFSGFGGSGGGGEDMMTQMAPMLEMMKAKMGKRRFAALMQTMGPMMSRMMEGGGGFGGMMGGIPGGFGGGIPAGFSGGYGGSYLPDGYGVSMGGGDFMGGLGSGELMSMVPQLMQIANVGGPRLGRRQKRR